MSQDTPIKRTRGAAASTEDAVASTPDNEQDDVSKRIAQMRKLRASRQSTNDLDANLKLYYPEEAKDSRFTYRFAVDTAGTGTRIHQLRARDWEVVPARDADQDPRNVGIGTTVERFANTKTVQNPDKHILMRKPKEFYAEDKAREQAKIKADEEALRQGNVKNPQGLSGPGAYIPAGGMKIEQGR